MSETNNIKALIHLIDDPDQFVFEHVRDRLLEFGPGAIPYLENSWAQDAYGHEFMVRVENLIHEIQFQDVYNQLLQWKSGQRDLLEGALIIAKYQYPGLNVDHINDFFSHLTREIWLEISCKLTAYEKINVINQVLYKEYQFKGDNKNFHSPLNSYINTVIELRKGNPLSLCIIYSVLAQRLGLPIYGVNLPNHFVLAYLDDDNTHDFGESKNNHGVKFYINCFSGGGFFDQEEVYDYLKRINVTPHRSHFEPCSNSTILARMLTNLIASYQQQGMMEKVKELTLLRKLIL